MKRTLIIVGVGLLVAAAVWNFGLSRTWTQRIPSGWSWVSNSILDQAYPDPKTNQLGNDKTNLYDRSIQAVAADNVPAGAVMLKDSLVTKNPASGAETYKSDFSAPVDPQTGAIVQSDYQGQYFIFPRNVQKTSYTIHQVNIPGIAVTFDKEETIEGLLTYLFSYQGAFVTTSNNPPLPAGQVTKCKDDQFIQRFWVEPVTGEIAKMEWGCLSALYVYDTATQKYLNPVARWHGISSSDDVLRHVGDIQAQRSTLAWVTTYIPLLLVVVGLLLVIGGIALSRKPSALATVPVTNQSPA